MRNLIEGPAGKRQATTRPADRLGDHEAAGTLVIQPTDPLGRLSTRCELDLTAA